MWQVKAKVNEIDTTKVKETLAKARDTASETLAHARIASEAQLQETTQQARQLADRQAKQLSKVNAKSLLNSNATFGVPLEALAYRDESGTPCDEARIPLPLEMMIACLESSPTVTSGLHILYYTCNCSIGIFVCAPPCRDGEHENPLRWVGLAASDLYLFFL